MKQPICNSCHNQKYIIVPKGRSSFAEKCNSCFNSCKNCGDTGFTFNFDQQGREYAQKCGCQIMEYKVKLYNQAKIPDRYYDSSLNNFQAHKQQKLKQALDAAIHSSRNYKPGMKGLLFHGSVGTGKTRLVCSMIREFIFRHSTVCKFVEFTSLLSEIKSGYDSGISESVLLQKISESEILVIDELGKGRNSEWENNILDIIISERYNSRKTTLFTTNYTENKQTTYKETFRQKNRDQEGKEFANKETLKERLQGRIYSRLKEMCTFIDMALVDYRISHENHEDYVTF